MDAVHQRDGKGSKASHDESQISNRHERSPLIIRRDPSTLSPVSQEILGGLDRNRVEFGGPMANGTHKNIVVNEKIHIFYMGNNDSEQKSGCLSGRSQLFGLSRVTWPILRPGRAWVLP